MEDERCTFIRRREESGRECVSACCIWILLDLGMEYRRGLIGIEAVTWKQDSDGHGASGTDRWHYDGILCMALGGKYLLAAMGMELKGELVSDLGGWFKR